MTLIQFTALLAIVSTAASHGFISKINVVGKEYPGYDTNTAPYAASPPQLIAWSTTATDEGYVEDVNSPDIICHEGAAPGALSAEVPAGGMVTVTWNQWPVDHKGPVIDYLASCNGDCSNVDKTALKFFKIDQDGLDSDTWGSEKLNQQGNSWDITIPSDIKAGNYVLRHEIIALHSTGTPQSYPQCVNLKVTGGGSSTPQGTPGMQLYMANEPGLRVNIWGLARNANYKVPGPQVYTVGGSKAAPAADSSSTATETSEPPAAKTDITTTSRSSTSAESKSSTEKERFDLKARDEEERAEDVKRSFTDGVLVFQLGGANWNCTRL